MTNTTVLIVDDDQNMRKIYSDAFEAAKLNVLVAENGSDGVKMALEHHPDVILMDIVMPVMDGHVAANNIRNDLWGRNAKIIYLTNMTDAENIVHAVALGSEDYIIKANTSIREVLNTVRSIANTK
jgi:CheY-like chemotaxis protein